VVDNYHAVYTRSGVIYTRYHPSLIEILTGSAIITYGLTLRSLGVKYLCFVDHTIIEEEYETADANSTKTVPAQVLTTPLRNDYLNSKAWITYKLQKVRSINRQRILPINLDEYMMCRSKT